MSAANDLTQTQTSTLMRLRTEKKAVTEKILSLEAEKKEILLVLDVLTKTDPERKCCRLVGGVLVPRTAKEVIPILQSNRDKITEAINVLNKTLTTLQKKQEDISQQIYPFHDERHKNEANETSSEPKITDTLEMRESQTNCRGGVVV